MATKDMDHTTHRPWFNENVRGILIVVAGSAALVGLAFGAMLVLTAPDGWVTKAARSALSGEPTSLVSLGSVDRQ